MLSIKQKLYSKTHRNKDNFFNSWWRKFQNWMVRSECFTIARFLQRLALNNAFNAMTRLYIRYQQLKPTFSSDNSLHLCYLFFCFCSQLIEFIIMNKSKKLMNFRSIQGSPHNFLSLFVCNHLLTIFIIIHLCQICHFAMSLLDN